MIWLKTILSKIKINIGLTIKTEKERKVSI